MEFKLIDGFNGRYCVFPDGRVSSMILGNGKGVNDKPIRDIIPTDNKGYKRVSLRVSKWNDPVVGKYVHRLVAEAFIPNPNGLKEVNHIDGNKANNSIENLEWVNRQQNIDHAWDNNLSTNAMNKGKGLTLYIATSINDGKIYKFLGGESLKEAGFEKSGVSKYVCGKRKQYKGLTWKAIKSPDLMK